MGRPQPFGPPVRLRAHVIGSVLSGLLGLLTAGLLVWFAVANIQVNGAPESWPSGVRLNVFGGFGIAGLLSILAALTLARIVAGVWTLGATSLFLAIMNVTLSPLMGVEGLSAQLDFVFGFHTTTGVAIGLTTIVGTLTAIGAAVAAIAKQP